MKGILPGLFIVAWMAAACEKFTTLKIDCSCAPPSDSIVVTANYGQRAIAYSCCENEISLSFVKVLQDSRCPTTVNCPWQGTAIIGITVNDEDQITALEINQPVSRKLLDFNYTLELIDLSPYPNDISPTPLNQYVAKIRIKRS